MREWLKNLSEIDQDCVHQYEFLLGRKLSGHKEYSEIDAQVEEVILEWENRQEFFNAYPDLRKYEEEPDREFSTFRNPTAHPYDGMLPNPSKPGYRGYYPVTSREEWDALPDLYKVMEWEPVKDPHNNNQLRAVKAVIFDVPHVTPYGVRAKVSLHPEDVHQILFCSFPKTDCHLYSICGIELVSGTRMPAKWLQDTTTGAFGIFVNNECIARQGGFQGYIPEHILQLEDGTFQFDFQYGIGKTVHYALHNPYPSPEKNLSLNNRIDNAGLKAAVSPVTDRNEPPDVRSPER